MKFQIKKCETGELIAEFASLEEAIEYADEHDLHSIEIDMAEYIKKKVAN